MSATGQLMVRDPWTAAFLDRRSDPTDRLAGYKRNLAEQRDWATRIERPKLGEESLENTAYFKRLFALMASMAYLGFRLPPYR